MSSNLTPRKNKPLRNGPPERFQPKVLFIWLAILALMFALLSTNRGATQHQTLTVSQLMEAAQKGDIESLTVQANADSSQYEFSGTLKPSSVQQPAQKDGEKPAVVATAFSGNGRLTDASFDKLRGFVPTMKESAPSMWGSVLVSLLPILLIAFLLIFMFRQFRAGSKGAMNFGKSRAKLLSREKDRVTFQDVAGCDEAKEEVSEIVEFLKAPKKFQAIGGRIPKGILMVGPPGTGKTLLARAVAGEAEVPFFSISGSDFVEMFVGVGAARVRDMFEQGRKSAPCLIFIDEIDAVGRQRGAGLGGGNDEREQTLNSLLVEMDGFDGHEGVIIIAATNRPDVLDAALLRPGRFDRQVVIDLPDLFGREEILKVHAKKVKMAEGVDLRDVARSTPGFSGADLANIINEAALLAARRDKLEVDRSDLDEAREKISYGRERRKLMDESDKKVVAYHEAGHALVQAVVDDGQLPIHKVTIIPRGQSLGSTMMAPTKDVLNQGQKRLLNSICCAMGGRVAEETVLGDITTGASGDIKHATKIARHMVCDWGMSPLGPLSFGENQEHIFLGKEIARNQNYSEETARRIDAEIGKIVQAQYERAKDIVVSKRDALEKIAQALLTYETIEGKHVHEILEFGEMRSPVVLGRARSELVTVVKDPSAESSHEPTASGDVAPEPTTA